MGYKALSALGLLACCPFPAAGAEQFLDNGFTIRVKEIAGDDIAQSLPDRVLGWYLIHLFSRFVPCTNHKVWIG